MSFLKGLFGSKDADSKAAPAAKPAKPTWRQGDVFIFPVDRFPEGARRSHNGVLAKGEITGHAHRVAEMGSADVFSISGELFMDVQDASATVLHEEHGPVNLPRGRYAVRIQREYTPKEIVRVVD
jgi:hypothetical protein